MARYVLIFAALVAAFFSPAHAQSQDVLCPGIQEARDNCEAYKATQPEHYTCKLSSYPPTSFEVRAIGPGGVWGPAWGGECPRNMCANRQPKTMKIPGSTDFSSGAAAYACSNDCQYAMTNAKSWGSGSTVGAWTSGTGVPTGRFCGQDGAASPPPADPPDAPTCASSGTCYKPDGDKYCATRADGSSLCVDAPKEPTDSGGCKSDAQGFICAGAPKAPSPPAPDPSKPDEKPPVKTDDNFGGYKGGATGGTDPGTGGKPQNDNVTTGGPSGNGNDPGTDPKPGDGGDCDPKTTTCPDDGDPGHAGGGTTCDAAPSCDGDAVGCAILYQQWRGRCETAKLNDVFTTKGLPKQDDDPSSGDVIKEKTLGDGSDGGSALDESGYGLVRSCPIRPFTFSLMGHVVDVDYTRVCDYLEIGRYILLIAAYLIAARILMGIH